MLKVFFFPPQVRTRILLLPLSWKNRNFKEGTSFKPVQVTCLYHTRCIPRGIPDCVDEWRMKYLWMKKIRRGPNVWIRAFIREVTGTFSWLLYIMISRGTRSTTSSIASPRERHQLDPEKAVTYYKPPSVFKYKLWKNLSFTWIFSFSCYFIFFLEAKHCTFYFTKVI